jgi:hypothetical protein
VHLLKKTKRHYPKENWERQLWPYFPAKKKEEINND